jgi:hypothetical protein
MNNRIVAWKPINLFPESADDDDKIMPEEGEDEQFGLSSKISITSLGPIQINDENHPFREVYFTVGHINFDLTKDIVEKVSKIPGVEYLRPISRYRFIMGIGMLFDKDETKQEVEMTLGIMEDEHPIVSAIKEDLSIKYGNESWAGYVFPNGAVVDTKVSTDDELQDALLKFTELQRLSDGVIIP